MGDLRDLPVIGALFSAGYVFVDVLAQAPDIVIAIVVSLLGSADVLVPFLSVIDRLADQFGWLPADLTQTLLTLALLGLALNYGIKLIARVKNED